MRSLPHHSLKCQGALLPPSESFPQSKPGESSHQLGMNRTAPLILPAIGEEETPFAHQLPTDGWAAHRPLPQRPVFLQRDRFDNNTPRQPRAKEAPIPTCRLDDVLVMAFFPHQILSDRKSVV